MKLNHFLISIVTLVLVSCGKREEAGHGHDHGEGVSNFKAGKGILFSKETLYSLGIQCAEISERPLTSVLTATAQIYRSADEVSSMNGLYKNGNAYASAPLPSELWVDFKANAQISVLDASGNEMKSCRMIRMDESLKAATQTVEALLEIPDSSSALPIGSFVRVRFYPEKSRILTAVPHSALLKTVEGNFVYVQNGKYLLRTAVQVGVSDADGMEIKDGLLPGDIIVTSQVEALWLTELRATKGGGHCH